MFSMGVFFFFFTLLSPLLTDRTARAVENFGRDAVCGRRDGQYRRRAEALPRHEQPSPTRRYRTGVERALTCICQYGAVIFMEQG